MADRPEIQVMDRPGSKRRPVIDIAGPHELGHNEPSGMDRKPVDGPVARPIVPPAPLEPLPKDEQESNIRGVIRGLTAYAGTRSQPDRNQVHELGARIVRGIYGSGADTLGSLTEMAGDLSGVQALSEAGELGQELGAMARAIVPVSKDRSGVEKFVGDVAESAPMFAGQVGASVVGQAVGVPAPVTFAATAAGPVIADRYTEAKAYYISQGYEENAAAWLAAEEAMVDGLMTAAVNAVGGKFLFNTPLGRAAQSRVKQIAGRLAMGVMSEGGTEGAEKVLNDLTSGVQRAALDGDMELLDQMTEGEYWGDVLWEGAIGAALGGPAAVAVGGTSAESQETQDGVQAEAQQAEAPETEGTAEEAATPEATEAVGEAAKSGTRASRRLGPVSIGTQLSDERVRDLARERGIDPNQSIGVLRAKLAQFNPSVTTTTEAVGEGEADATRSDSKTSDPSQQQRPGQTEIRQPADSQASTSEGQTETRTGPRRVDPQETQRTESESRDKSVDPSQQRTADAAEGKGEAELPTRLSDLRKMAESMGLDSSGTLSEVRGRIREAQTNPNKSRPDDVDDAPQVASQPGTKIPAAQVSATESRRGDLATPSQTVSESTRPVPSQQRTADTAEGKQEGTVTEGEAGEAEVARPTIVRGEGEQSPEGMTSARRVDIDRDRESLGLDELDSPDRRSWKSLLETVKADEGNDDRANRLANEVIQKPRAFSDQETASVVLRTAELKNQHKAVMDEIGKTEDQSRLSELTLEAQAIESEFDILSSSIRASGTEKGRALASQKLTLNEDYQLVSVLNRAKAKRGRDLTKTQRETFEKFTKRLEAKDKEVKALERRLKNMMARKAVRSSRRRDAPSKKNVDQLYEKARRLLEAGCLNN